MNWLRPILLCFLLPATLLLCRSLPAQNPPPCYACGHAMNHLLHWPRFPVRVYFVPGSLNTSERVKEVVAGFNEWVDATQGVACYQVVTDKTAADLTVTFSDQISLPKADRSFGQTVLTFDGTTLTKAEMQLVEREDVPKQFQEICAHEFGHVLGIDGHSDDPDDMMFPVLSHSLFQVTNPELDWLCTPSSVTTRDVNTLAAAYPALVFPSKKH